MAETATTKSSPVLVATAWLLVLVPTGWGLTYTVQNALKLFRAPAPAAAAPAVPAATAPASTAPAR